MCFVFPINIYVRYMCFSFATYGPLHSEAMSALFNRCAFGTREHCMQGLQNPRLGSFLGSYCSQICKLFEINNYIYIYMQMQMQYVRKV